MNVDLPDNVRVLDCIYTTEKVMWKKQQEMWSYKGSYLIIHHVGNQTQKWIESRFWEWRLKCIK